MVAAPSTRLTQAVSPAPLPVVAIVPAVVVAPTRLSPLPPPPSRLVLPGGPAPSPNVRVIPARVETRAAPAVQPVLPPAAPPAIRTSPAPPAPATPSRVAVRANEAPRPVVRAAAGEAVLPFDASLETILYGTDRKLAIVDGRIVQAGDDVKGARIVEITPTAVMLRDSQGRLRRLSVGTTDR
jgi:hypothetical protein